MKNAELSPLVSNFGTCVRGIDLARITDEDAKWLRNILHESGVLVIKDQKLEIPEYINFARKLGDPVKFVDPNYHHPEHPEIFVVSNVKVNGQNLGMDRVGYYWHSDSSFMPNPLPVTMLYAQRVPAEGGETSFVDMADVYARLPQVLRTLIEGKQARHESKWRYIIMPSDAGLSIEEVLERDEREVPSSVHPVVITHPTTGKKVLYVSEGFTRRILGVSAELSDELLKTFFELVQSNEARYVHKWSAGDVILWDNRSVVHRAAPAAKGQDRMMFRIGVNDGAFNV